MSENERSGWYHQCNGHEPGQTSGVARDWEAWHAAVHVVAKTWICLGN